MHVIAAVGSTSTLYHTVTLVNVPVTIASATIAQTAATAVPAAVAQPYAWRGGGDTLTPPVVAVVVSILGIFTPILGHRKAVFDYFLPELAISELQASLNRLQVKECLRLISLR